MIDNLQNLWVSFLNLRIDDMDKGVTASNNGDDNYESERLSSCQQVCPMVLNISNSGLLLILVYVN